jgi:flagellar basal body-associated protein FliL
LAFDFRRELDRFQDNVKRNPKLLIGIGVAAVFLITFVVLYSFVFGRSDRPLTQQELDRAKALAEEQAKAQADYERDNPPPPPPPTTEKGPARPKP